MRAAAPADGVRGEADGRAGQSTCEHLCTFAHLVASLRESRATVTRGRSQVVIIMERVVRLRLAGAPPMQAKEDVPAPAKRKREPSWRCCACKTIDHDAFMIGCDSCERWYHGYCVGMTLEEADRVEEWRCPGCEQADHAAIQAVIERMVVRIEKAEASAQSDIRRLIDRLVTSVEKHAASEEKLTRASAAKQDAKDAKELTSAIEWLVAQTERAFRVVHDSPVTNSRAEGRGGKIVFAATGAGSSCSLPSVLRPAADGGYYYERVFMAHKDPREPTLSSAPHIPSTGGGGQRLRGSSCEEGPRCLIFELLTSDCLAEILSKLPLPALLLSAVPTCHRLAIASEPSFEAHCRQCGWRLGRRGRGGGSGPCAWRQLLRSHGCAVCLSPAANFPVRRATPHRYGAIIAKLCCACARRGEAQSYAGSMRLEIDTMGLDGRPLFSRTFS